MTLVPLLALKAQERTFDTLHLEAYKEQAEFNYAQDYSQSDSFLSLITQYFFSKIASIFGHVGNSMSPVIFKVILLIAIVLALVFIMRLKFGSAVIRGPGSFNSLPLQFMEGEKEDYHKLMQESLVNQQFKMAIRYLFFSSLHTLEQQKQLKITKWKAPYDYIKELPEGKRSDFKQIVDLFENTWYGDFSPDQQMVDKGVQVYKNLKHA